MNPIRIADLPPVARMLLVPLACRAEENKRSDAMIHDDLAQAVLARFDPKEIAPLRMAGHDHTFTMMRARQFDRQARAFLDTHPDCVMVELGCGLDTRPARIDNGRRTWIGLDLSEVVSLRRLLLPPGPRETLLEGSLTDPAWMDRVDARGKPVFFSAEGVFVYLNGEDLRRTVTLMAQRFPGSELVFEAMKGYMIRLDNLHPQLHSAGARLRWGLEDPHSVEEWSPRIRLAETWTYFGRREPRLGAANAMRFIPFLARANYILRYHFTEERQPKNGKGFKAQYSNRKRMPL
jgi:O-methyltransferase involved in polyketide biosynthesis